MSEEKEGFWKRVAKKILVKTAVYAVIAIILWLMISKLVSVVAPDVTTTDNERIDSTEVVVKNIETSRQWVFLKIPVEEVVSREKGLIWKDNLTKKFKGQIELGLDLRMMLPGWAKYKPGDFSHIELNMPPIEILNNEFLDEAASQTLIDEGSWSLEEKKLMKEEAIEKMSQQALSLHNVEAAEALARRELTEKFLKLGYKDVKVNISRIYDYDEGK